MKKCMKCGKHKGVMKLLPNADILCQACYDNSKTIELKDIDKVNKIPWYLRGDKD